MATASNGKGEDLLVVTFQLDRGRFGLDTALVQEVVMAGEITRVHHAPGYVAGIRNLRGRIVTLVDLRARLELAKADITPESRVLIADWNGEPVGLLVDRMHETLEVNTADLQAPPPNLNGVRARYLRGVVQTDDRLIALFEMTAVLSPAEERSAASEAGR